MKHYHTKKNLGENDVKYIIVKVGDNYFLEFKEVDTLFNGRYLIQGVKFWFNRCKIVINDEPVDTEQIIVWFSNTPKKRRSSSNHIYYYCDSIISFQVVETIDENPNIGIFNVWSINDRNCYEFGDESFIKEQIKGNTHYFQAKHGFSKEDSSTMKFEIQNQSSEGENNNKSEPKPTFFQKFSKFIK